VIVRDPLNRSFRIVKPEGVPDDAILRILRVPPESAGMRLDVFVQSQLRNTSRTRARAIVENSAFSPDGRRLRANDRVRAEERVILWRPQFEFEDDLFDLVVLHEDEHLIVIDKPPLVAVHPTARYYRNTVIKRLQSERPSEYLSLVHRLDRETSGILLIARSVEADRAFKRMFEDRSLEVARGCVSESGNVEKTYLAITWGTPDPGIIDAALEPDVDNPLRVKMRIARRGQGMESRTGVEVLESRAGYALLSLRLFTGRQHQIRIHLASIGCPVVGDKLYGPDERLHARGADGLLDAADLARLELPRHALHAARYRMPHPLDGGVLDLVSPLPADLAAFWSKLAET
jgi:23S rRNA pseudouridine1911/1915/1917 synthase